MQEKLVKNLTNCSEVGRSARGGRPAQFSREEREALILDAVESAIGKFGLQGASMNAIAREAGMSKRTIYAIYDSRDELFAAWVRRLRASFVRPLTEEERAAPIDFRLRRLLRREAHDCGSDSRLNVLRAMIAEAPRHPELARTFMREGAYAARAILSDELALARDAGEIEIADPDAAAHLLFDMAFPKPLERLIDPDEPPLTLEAADARMELGISVFLRAVATKKANR